MEPVAALPRVLVCRLRGRFPFPLPPRTIGEQKAKVKDFSKQINWRKPFGKTQMTGLRSTLALIILMTAALVFGERGSPSPVLAKTAEGTSPCSLGSLPSDIQNRLKGEFGSWKVQEQENLSEYTRKTWAGKKPSACPGIAVGLFQSAKIPSYALLLVPLDHPDAGYRFLVFSSKTGQRSYETTVVEKSDDHGAATYFIRKVSISRYFSEESKRKFQVQATEAILMVDSAEQEYGADIYVWSNGRFRRESVDD
jgi:hypothetical protein